MGLDEANILKIFMETSLNHNNANNNIRKVQSSHLAKADDHSVLHSYLDLNEKQTKNALIEGARKEKLDVRVLECVKEAQIEQYLERKTKGKNPTIGATKMDMTIFFERASKIAKHDDAWEKGMKVLLEEAQVKGLPIDKIQRFFVTEKKKQNELKKENNHSIGIDRPDDEESYSDCCNDVSYSINAAGNDLSHEFPTSEGNSKLYSSPPCRTHQIAEYRDTNNGDVEAYIMEEQNVEVAVAFVNEYEETKAEPFVNEKKEIKAVPFVKLETCSPKNLNRANNVVLGRKIKSEGSPRQIMRSTFFRPKSKKIAAIERYYEIHQERQLRNKLYNNISVAKDTDELLTNHSCQSVVSSQTPFDVRIVGQTKINQKVCAGKTAVAQTVHSSPALLPINGVAAAEALCSRLRTRVVRTRHLSIVHHWHKSYDDRVSRHTGYIHVDVHSLEKSSSVTRPSHYFDNVPWEHRDIKQQSLYEKSL